MVSGWAGSTRAAPRVPGLAARLPLDNNGSARHHFQNHDFVWSESLVVMMSRAMGDIDVGLLRVFEAVLAERHITRAARRLNVTQSAVSNSLARLRRLFDDELFVRTPDGMQPTDTALSIAEPVAAALDAIRTALAVKLPFDPATDEATFTLGLSEYAEMVLAPPLVTRLGSTAPGIRLVVRHVERGDGLRLLDEGLIDLTAGVLPAPRPHMLAETLADDDMATLMRRGHPAAARLDFARYLDHGHLLVSARGATVGAIDRLLEAQGQARRLVAVVGHLSAVPPILRDSDLLCTMAGRLVRDLARIHDLAWAPTPMALKPLRLSMIWHRRQDRRPGHIWLRQQLRQTAAGLEKTFATPPET